MRARPGTNSAARRRTPGRGALKPPPGGRLTLTAVQPAGDWASAAATQAANQRAVQCPVRARSGKAGAGGLPAAMEDKVAFTPRTGTVEDMAAGLVTLFVSGDVMLGRGVDQILPHPSDPRLRETYARDARAYVR